MRNIGEVLGDLAEGDWRANIRRAAALAKMEETARRCIADEGFADISCRAASCENGELRLTVADSSACAVLRQMQKTILSELQREFPAIRTVSFGIQL